MTGFERGFKATSGTASEAALAADRISVCVVADCCRKKSQTEAIVRLGKQSRGLALAWQMGHAIGVEVDARDRLEVDGFAVLLSDFCLHEVIQCKQNV